jgi:hypothetical protein
MTKVQTAKVVAHLADAVESIEKARTIIRRSKSQNKEIMKLNVESLWKTKKNVEKMSSFIEFLVDK